MTYKIKELREKRKMTQTQLSEKSGVSRATIIKLENEENPEVEVGTLKSLASALGVKIQSLFGQ